MITRIPKASLKILTLSALLSLLVAGCGDKISQPRGGENERPVANLLVPETASVGDTVLLDASESFDSDGSIIEYRFTTITDGEIMVTAEDYLVWSYDQPGSYTITLTVVDNRGGKDSLAVPISIQL